MSKPFANPFFEADMTKLFSVPKMSGDMRMPEFSPEALMTMQRKNMETYAALGQTMMESYKALWQRQMDMCRQVMTEVSQTAGSIMSCPTPEEKVIRQAEAGKMAMEKCLANVCDITETLAKCNNQAMETVSTRMSEGLDELRGIIKNRAA